MATPLRPAAVYGRQSHGKERSIDEQVEIGQARCTEEGWAVRGVYTDRVSASRFTRQAREDWPRLIADIEVGLLGVLWIWESSRGDRDPESWLGLLRRCRNTGTLIYVETHERLYDITRPRDWRTLADEGIGNAYYSEETSLRVIRDLAKNARKGRPHGVTLYGYERIYDAHTRELVEQREHPHRAPVVREIFGEFDQGVSLGAITGALNTWGFPAPRGEQWTHATVRQILSNPAYIGQRRAGSTMAVRTFTETYDAVWPAIVDEALFWRVQRRLKDPARKMTKPGKLKWLLSYVATCAECGGALTGAAGGRQYKCGPKSCVYVDREILDAWVTDRVIYVIETRGQEALQESAASDKDVVGALAEADRLQFQLDEMARDIGLSPRLLAIREGEILPRIEAARERARRASRPPALVHFTNDDVRAQWDAAPLSVRREILKALLTVTVRKSLRRGEFAGDRATITRAGQ